MSKGIAVRPRKTRFLLQMAGEPGSGKSALAQAIGRATGAVVLDKDVIKSAALNVGIGESLAGPLAYEVFFDLARSLVAMGHDVILDSPAYYSAIREKGRAIAEELSAQYLIIECRCPSREELGRRLQHRKRLPSQPVEVIDWPARDGTLPLTETRLALDMSRPLSECLPEALRYLDSDPG